MLFFNGPTSWSSRDYDTSKYCLTVVPAMVFNEGKIKIMGVCPSEETLKSALREAGL
jgi:predicted DsbA family dithiol-disulfide isomerase